MSKTALFRLAFRVLPYVPHGVAQRGALAAGWLMWLALPRLRARVRASLAHIPTLAHDPARLDQVTRRCFQHLLLNYVDLFSPPPPDLLQRYTLHGIDLFQAAHDRGKGCLLLSVHSSAFEWSRYALSQLLAGTIVVPAEAIEPPELFELVTAQRNKSGLRFVPITAGTTLREMIAALRRGENVLMALDRDVVQTGVVMPVFGAPARIPTGAITLARQTGAAVLFIGGWREGLNRFAGEVVAPPIEITSATRGDAAMRAALAPLVRAMEDAIARRPEQWLAAFATDVWVDAPAAATTADSAATPAPLAAESAAP